MVAVRMIMLAMAALCLTAPAMAASPFMGLRGQAGQSVTNAAGATMTLYRDAACKYNMSDINKFMPGPFTQPGGCNAFFGMGLQMTCDTKTQAFYYGVWQNDPMCKNAPTVSISAANTNPSGGCGPVSLTSNGIAMPIYGQISCSFSDATPTTGADDAQVSTMQPTTTASVPATTTTTTTTTVTDNGPFHAERSVSRTGNNVKYSVSMSLGAGGQSRFNPKSLVRTIQEAVGGTQ